jgi:hypothetical protein
VFAAVLVVGCAGQQAETRPTAADDRAPTEGQSAQAGGQTASEATAAAEQAPSQRPSSGIGSQDPHPVATNPDDPKYGGTAESGDAQRPGLEGRPGIQREGTASAGMSGAMEQNAVYGQVNEVSDDELEIEPAYGEPVKVKLDDSAQATATALEEGDEVRVSFDERDGDKIAIEVQQDPPASAIEDLIPSSSSTMDDSSGAKDDAGTIR